MEKWTAQKSADLFGFPHWGKDYFSISPSGEVIVHPEGPNGSEVNLHEITKAAIERGIGLPVLFRFNGILRHRIQQLVGAFQAAAEAENFKGDYIPVYPIKVNQQRHIVEVLAESGESANLGLEVGSKPELIAVLAQEHNSRSLLVCNGYKDEEYVELALLAEQLGRKPIIVVEKLSELKLIIRTAERLGIEPRVGFRLRLAGRGAGRWEKSSGERAKFGLTVSEVLEGLAQLKAAEKLSSLQLLHFHIGSQITAINSLKDALREAAQIYVQVKARASSLSYLDIGGGLGVDYDGSKTNFESSMNYTIEEYARDVLWVLGEVCEKAGVAHPTVLSESGRALVAHHALLVFNVLGIANTFRSELEPDQVLEQTKHVTLRNLAQLLKETSPKNCQESLHDAIALRAELLSQFNLGLLSIEERALGDKLFWAAIGRIRENSRELHFIPEDLERVPSMLVDTYFCNFSVFQSLPDSWAIEQIFPVTPVHRLEEEPTRHVVLADITCDSDGKLDRFPDLKDVKHALPAHELKHGEDYYFSAFLVGAYQEILGDLHNLFGDTNAVHVEVEADGTVRFDNVIYGDTVREVLRFVQYEKEALVEQVRRLLERAVSEGTISVTDSASMLTKYAASFEGYTYLSSNAINGTS